MEHILFSLKVEQFVFAPYPMPIPHYQLSRITLVSSLSLSVPPLSLFVPAKYFWNPLFHLHVTTLTLSYQASAALSICGRSFTQQHVQSSNGNQIILKPLDGFLMALE